jgi:C4-dicarboxylate-specific signal transduction histidine kinase
MNYDGSSNREQLEELKSVFPRLKYADIRRLVHLSENGMKHASELYAINNIDTLASSLKFAEAGLHVRRIRITSGRISSLVKSLKRYSKQESTGDTRTDLKNGLIDTIQILGNRLKNVKLNLNISDNFPDVHFDAGELNQVWTNLIINACDALKDKGIIEIKALKKGDKIQVSIGDSGPGIPEENWDKIFLPHFTTRNSSGNFGLGLGLSITRELVAKNLGHIEVKKSNLGGAEFILELIMAN